MTYRSNILKSALFAAVSAAALAAPGAASAQASAPAPAPTPAQTDAATPIDDQVGEDIIVTGVAGGDGLRKLDASFSITTASSEQIREAAPTSVADLLKIVPGVYGHSSSGETGANLYIRGFPSGGDAPYFTIEVNGSPIFPPPTLSFLENSSLFRLDDTIERVEVLRGGPSPIFANGQPGATTNFILKQGTETLQGSLRATLGTEGLYRGDFVVQGPVAEDTSFMIGGFYRTSDGLRKTQFPANRGGQITASLTHKFANGEVTLYGRHLDDKNAFYTALPLLANASGDVSGFPGFDPGSATLIGNEIRRATIEIAPGNPPQTKRLDLGDGRGAKVTLLGATFDFDFGGFQLWNRMNFLKGTADTNALFTGGNPLSLSDYIAGRVASANAAPAVVAAAGRLATGGTATFAASGAPAPGTQQVLEAGLWFVSKQIESFTDELRLSREIFQGNTLTLGGYFADYSSRDLWFLGNNAVLAVEPNARLINLTLNNGAVATRAGIASSPNFAVNASYNGRNTALYLADEWKLGKLRLDGGIRWERQTVNATLENNSTADFDGNPLTLYNNGAAYLNGTYRTIDYGKSKVSWTGGATYALTDRFNVFARANSGYAFPQFDGLRDGQDKTLTVKQYEVGAKTSNPLFDVFLTGFYNRFKGLQFQQFLQDGTNLLRFGGSRSYGLEFDGAVRPIDGAQIAARGVIQNARYKDFGTNTGNTVSGQPSFSISVLPSYQFETGMGRARLFGNYTHVGKRFSDSENQQPLKPYDTVDLGASLDVGEHFSVQATVVNLFDTLALTEGNARVIGGATTGGVFLGRPIFGRHGLLTAAYKF